MLITTMTTKELIKKYGFRKCFDEKGKRYIIVPFEAEIEEALKIANSYFRQSYSELDIRYVYATKKGKKVYMKKKLLVVGEKKYWGICQKPSKNYEDITT